MILNIWKQITQNTETEIFGRKKNNQTIKKIINSGIISVSHIVTQDSSILIRTMTIFQWTTVQANYVYKVVAEQEKKRTQKHEQCSC